MTTTEKQVKPQKETQSTISEKVVQRELYQKSLDQKLLNLKALNLQEAVVNLWVADVKIRNKAKRFNKIKRLQLHETAEISFKGYVTKCIAYYEHIVELKNISTNQDNRFFYLESAATDLSQLINLIEEGDVSTLSNKSELNSYNAYAIQLTFGEEEQSLFAFRYISGSWSVNNSAGRFFGFKTIDNELIAKIEEDFKFQINPHIDFIQFQDDVFISDVKQFETAMNYHERLQEKKGVAIAALCQSTALSTHSKDPLTRVIGSDKFLMRQLASVYEKGYFKNEIWLKKLKKAAEDAGTWKIKFDDSGEIIIEENKEYIKELLILLQNKRVKTVVDGVIFDVDGELIAVATS